MIYLFYICLTFINYINIKPKNLMKKNFTLFAFATMMLLGMSSVFYACSNDDDNNGNQQELGDKAVAELKNLVFDENGNIMFSETETAGLYEFGVGEKSDAAVIVAKYVNNAGFKDGKAEYQLPDNRGKVIVNEGNEEGVFYQVQFTVKEIPVKTLLVEEINYMMGQENKTKATNTWRCTDCNSIFSKPKAVTNPVCPKCNSNKVEAYK